MNWTPKAVAQLFWAFLVLDAALSLALPELIFQSQGYFFATGFLMLLLIFSWFLLDARANGLEPSIWLKLAVVILAPIAVPYYKFRYTGFVAGVRFIVVIVGLGLALVAIQYAISTLL